MQLHKPQTSANDDWQGQNQCKSTHTLFERIPQERNTDCYVTQLWPTTVIRIISDKPWKTNIAKQLQLANYFCVYCKYIYTVTVSLQFSQKMQHFSQKIVPIANVLVFTCLLFLFALQQHKKNKEKSNLIKFHKELKMAPSQNCKK